MGATSSRASGTSTSFCPSLAEARAAVRPAQELVAEHEPGRLVDDDECAVWKPAEGRVVVALHAPVRVEPLLVQLQVDGVGSGLPRMPAPPELAEADVVLPAAQRTRPVPGREGRRLVEEEELGEPARLQERRTPPTPELQPAGDPAAHGEAASDPALVVVEAAAVPVDEATLGNGDEVAERGDTVCKRHR